MSKEKELPLKLFLESSQYQLLKQEIHEELNHNSQMMNRNHSKNIKIYGNLVRKEQHKISEFERLQLKKAKKQYKNSKNTDIANKLKSEMLSILVKSNPNWNVSLEVLN